MRPLVLIALLAACSSTTETKTRVIGLDGGPVDSRSDCERFYDAAMATWTDAGKGVEAFGYLDKCVALCADARGIYEQANAFCFEWGLECTDPEPWHLPEDGGTEYSRPGVYDQYCTYADLD
jgi:hypothetical protein